MIRSIVVFLALFFAFALPVQSQTLADYQFSTGHDASRWYSLDSTRNLINMNGSRYYRRSSLEEIGFLFPFADSSYTQFSVTADGNLRLGSALAISSSGNQGAPFFPSRAGTNNPKINFMGCAGYSSDSVFVHKQLFGQAPNRILVVEFALQTYTTSSRPSLLRWQVQMYENGDIQIVYPSHNPPILPYCNRQQGMCVDETDVWIVDDSHVASHYTAGYSTYITSGHWPDTNRYYRFSYPVDVCPSPTSLVAAIIETSSITLSWNGNSNATGYLVEYSTTPFAPGTGNASQFAVADTTADIYGLLAGTHYYFYVRTVCGGGDTSNAAYVDATTLTVDPVTASSWSCDFESDNDRSGWIIPTGNLTARWYLGSAVNNTPNGQYALYVSQDSGATNSCGDNWIGTYAYRSLNLAAGDWNISFDWRAHGDWQTNSAGNTTYYQFLRAFLVPSSVSFTAQTPPHFPVSNATPHGTAVPQGWLELNPATHSFVNQTSWTTYSTTVRVNVPGCYNLLFYWESDGYDPPVDMPAAIDNVSIEHLTCAQPHTLTAQASDHEILIRWHRGGNENQWRVVSGSYETVVQDTFCLVTGLAFNTPYSFEVYAICAAGDTSLPATASFRTTAGEPVSAYPYFCDFEDSLTACQWVTLGEGQLNRWYVGNAANNTPQGQKSLYVSQDSGTTNTYSGSSRSLSYAYRMLALDTLDYICRFDWRCMGDDDFHFFRAFIVPSNSLPSAGSFPLSSNLHISVPSRWIDLNPQQHYMSGQSLWIPFAHSFRVADSGLYAILFMWENDNQAPANNPPAAIDNVAIQLYTCPTPDSLAADVSQTYIDLTWSGGDAAQVWLVEYADTAVTTFNPSYNAINLTPNTEYQFRVSTLCSNGDTSLPAILTVRTACMPIDTLPFICDFSQYPAGTGSSDAFLPCWNRLLNHSSYTPQVSNSFTSGDNCLYWSLTRGLLDDAIIVLPELAETIEVTYTEMRFRARKVNYLGLYDDPIIIVGVMSHPGSAASFAPVDTIVVTSEDGFQDYSVPFLSYSGSDQYVAIRAVTPDSANSMTLCLVDDIQLHELHYCRKPTSYSVEAGTDTALLTWTPGGDETQWILRYADTALTTNQPRHVMHNLQADREYLFSIASICGPGDTSDFIAGRFRTLPLPPNPPDTVECPDVFDVSATPNYPTNPYQITVCWRGEAQAYEVRVANLDGWVDDYTATVFDTTCCFFDLQGYGGLWAVVVRSLCDTNVYGEWSDTVFFDTPICIGINEPSVPNAQLSIYPNPTNGDATLMARTPAGTALITVVDLSGRIIKEQDVVTVAASTISIPLHNLPSGIYYVRLSTTDGITVRKLIVR